MWLKSKHTPTSTGGTGGFLALFRGLFWFSVKWLPVSPHLLLLTHPALLSSSGRNFLKTSELIRLPDDCTMGYIIECKVGGQLLPNALFHSHLENLQLIPTSRLTQQVSRENGMRERCARKGRGSEEQRLPAAQVTVTVARGQWWGTRVQGVMGGLGEHGKRTWRNADLGGKGLCTTSSLHGEITRGVGGLERAKDSSDGPLWAGGEERWKAEAKPAEKEKEHELLLPKASSLLLSSPPHPPCSFLPTPLCRSHSAMVSLRTSSTLSSSVVPSHCRKIPQGAGHE